MRPAILLAVILGAAAGPAAGDVLESAPDHYTLRQEAVSPLAPEALWARLIEPASWWQDDHTWSGSAGNLSLEAAAGGLWAERWDGNTVTHGTVLAALESRMLRLEAPFGPLQGMGVSVTWTITLEPDEETGGTRVVFDEIANGSSHSGLDQLALAVDRVKTEAVRRLAAGTGADD